MTAPRPPHYLSVAEIADVLQVSPMSVYRLVNNGDLHAYRIGRSVRIRPADFHQFMRESAVSRDRQDEA